MGQTVDGTLLELLEPPAGLGDADNRDVQTLISHQAEERRKDLLIGKVSGRSEEDQRVRWFWHQDCSSPTMAGLPTKR